MLTPSSNSASEGTTLVVAELGCGWPRWLEHVRHGLIVVAQVDDEHPGLLSRRVRKRIDALGAQGDVLTTAWMACGDRANVEVQDARENTSKAIFDAMRRSHGGHLVIAASSERESDPSPLWRLADHLVDGLAEPEIVVTVRFPALGQSGRRGRGTHVAGIQLIPSE